MRHKWRHLPCSCSRWEKAFSSALRPAARSGFMSTGRFTVIFTWNNIAGVLWLFVATEERQALFIDGQAQARSGGDMQVEIAVHQRLGEDVFGEQQRAEQLGVPRQFVQGEKDMGRGQGTDTAFEHGAAVQADARRFGNRRGAQYRARAAVFSDLQG